MEWFEKAAASGHPAAPGTLGRLWNSGALGEAGRDAKAIEWYDQGLARCDGWSGANAAWIIANRAPAGLPPARRGGARRQGRGAERRGLGRRGAEPPRDARRRRRSTAPPQSLVNALGGNVEVDGAFGPASVTEMQRVLGPAAVDAPQGTPTERLLALARSYWQGEPCRIDLY